MNKNIKNTIDTINKNLITKKIVAFINNVGYHEIKATYTCDIYSHNIKNGGIETFKYLTSINNFDKEVEENIYNIKNVLISYVYSNDFMLKINYIEGNIKHIDVYKNDELIIKIDKDNDTYTVYDIIYGISEEFTMMPFVNIPTTILYTIHLNKEYCSISEMVF